MMQAESVIALTLSMVSIAGAILNARKLKEGFVLWIIGNSGWILVNIFYQLWEQIPMWATYVAISSYGLFYWGKGKEVKNDK